MVFCFFLRSTETSQTGIYMNTTVPSPDLLLILQEANQRLVIASLKEQELREAAEQANIRQKEFLYMLAHELRNPLAPLAMVSHMLGKVATQHPETLQLSKISDIIARQVKQMSQLVENLLEASRIHSGKVTLHKKAVPLAAMLQGAIETCQPLLDQRHQHLALDLPETLVLLDGDEVRLSQIFSNLLINAAKFSTEGDTIEIAAHLLTHSRIAIEVIDHGIGIETAEQAHIFDLFTQGARSLDRAQGGLGIGLSLVRTLSELHGGTAEVFSAGHGLGCKFTITLPLSIPPAVEKTLSAALTQDAPATHQENTNALQTSPSRLAPCSIVVIEDNQDTNEIMRSCLELEGHQVVSAFDGLSGLALVRKIKPDVVVCDIGLPGLDGFGVIDQLRRADPTPVENFEKPGVQPLCIAVTGYHQLEYQSRAIKAGFDHYLVKPVELDSLIDLIGESCASVRVESLTDREP